MTKQTGLSIHTESLENGLIRIVLNDVASSGPAIWRNINLFTYVDVDAVAFASGEIDPNLLTQLGENVVLRLAALAKAYR